MFHNHLLGCVPDIDIIMIQFYELTLVTIPLIGMNYYCPRQVI